MNHQVLATYVLSEDATTRELEKKYDDILCIISLPSIIVSVYQQLNADDLVSLLNEVQLENAEDNVENQFEYADFLPNGKMYRIFLHTLIHVHGKLTAEDCFWWYYFERMMKYIHETYGQFFVPDGTVFSIKTSKVDSKEHMMTYLWWSAQLERPGKGIFFKTIARQPKDQNDSGDYHYQLMKTVGICFDKENVEDAIKKRQLDGSRGRESKVSKTASSVPPSDDLVAARIAAFNSFVR